MPFNQDEFRKNNGYVNPELYGFSDRIRDITLRMFPFQEHYEASTPSALTDDARRMLGWCKLENIEELLSNNVEARKMNHISWCSSLFSPDLTGPLAAAPRINRDDFEGTISGFFDKYVGYQFNTLIHHIFLHKGQGGGAFNTFLDCTDTSLFAKVCNVRDVLQLVENSSILSSLSDITGEIIQIATNHKRAILESIRADISHDIYLPIWKIFTILIYRAFYIILDPREDKTPGNRCRIYLYKRHGRFIGKRVGIGQYIRYFVWFQRPFSYFDNWYSPCQRCIFRDAHATGINIRSAEIDRTYFDVCSTRHERNIMLGISPLYKCGRHAELDLVNHTSLMMNYAEPPPDVPSFDNINPQRIGVLAGFISSYSHDLEQPFMAYDIFFQPFGDLEAAPRANGCKYPVAMLELDKLPRPNGVQWDYWGYGLDEYILGLLIQQRNTNPGLWDDINVLYFQVDWFGRVIGLEERLSEHYPVAVNVFRNIILPRLAGIKASSKNPTDYYNKLIDNYVLVSKFPSEPAGTPKQLMTKNCILEFLFSSVNIPAVYLAMHDIRPPDVESHISAHDITCMIYNIYRFDRFDYYNNPPARAGNIVPTSIYNFNKHLLWSCQNKITYGCGKGIINPADPCPNIDPCHVFGALLDQEAPLTLEGLLMRLVANAKL
jgi:hypothetical protein